MREAAIDLTLATIYSAISIYAGSCGETGPAYLIAVFAMALAAIGTSHLVLFAERSQP